MDKPTNWLTVGLSRRLFAKSSGACFTCKATMPKAKPVQLVRPMRFDEAMQRLVKLSPPPSGKKAKKKVWRKKRR